MLDINKNVEAYFKDWIKNEFCVVHVVRGNNDFFSHTEAEKEISIGKYRAFLCHGHMYGVSLGTENIKEEARSRKVNIVMFGHTHRPYYDVDKKKGDKDLIVLNPGSLSYPRQEGRRPSYVIMTLDKEGEAHFEFRYLDLEDDKDEFPENEWL